MVYLHCAPPKDIPFPTILNVPHVTIVIPRITVQELDKHKNTHPSQRVRERAQRCQCLIESMVAEQQMALREGVVLAYYHGNPSFDFGAHGLDRNWNDDLLIASVLSFKHVHPDTRVLLVSLDTGPKLTARHHGIDCIGVPEKYLLPPEENSHAKEIRQLKSELLRLQSASPLLRVSFQNSEDESAHCSFKLPPQPDISLEKREALIQAQRKAVPSLSVPTEQPAPPKTASQRIESYIAAARLKDIMGETIPTSEYLRYNKDVDAYIVSYASFLDRLTEYQTRPSRMITLKLELHNTGTVPADDIDLRMHFPNGFSMYTREDLPGEPSPPKHPDKPCRRSAFDLAGLAACNFDPIRVRMPHMPIIPDSFSLKRTNSYDLADHFNRLKHGDHIQLRKLFVVFPSHEKACSFEIEYRISAANVPKAVTGTLNVVIEK